MRQQKNHTYYFYLLFFIFSISIFMCSSCDDQLKIKDKGGTTKLLYSGSRYDLVEVNDSLYMIIPGMNSKDADQPQVILKQRNGNYVDSRVIDSTDINNYNNNNIEENINE